jgi:hypothetical protein
MKMRCEELNYGLDIVVMWDANDISAILLDVEEKCS